MSTYSHTNPNSGSQIIGCPYCIDRHQPAGSDPQLGPLYITCAQCGPTCPGCDGEAVIPAAPAATEALIASCNATGWVPIFCPACMGITRLVRFGPSPETTGP
jgi:hypothetical protein